MIIDARKGQRVYIGRIGENETRQIRFDIRRIREEFPDAELSFLNKRPTDADAYPVNGQYITVDGGYLYWTVQSGDLEYVGFGECEIKATKNGQVLKDEIYQTQIKRALDGNGNPPEPWESWQQQVADDADRAEAAAALLENPGAEAETLAPGSSATAAYAEGVFAFGIPKGEKGDTGAPGQDGQDGFSPTAAVSKSGSTATITITDKNGTTTAEVSDGQDGAPGQDGADGFSPTATVSKSGSTATITITDKNGTTTEQISDGDPTTIIDDTSTAQNKVWSANKSNDLKRIMEQLSYYSDKLMYNLLKTGSVEIEPDFYQGNIISSTGALQPTDLTRCTSEYILVPEGATIETTVDTGYRRNNTAWYAADMTFIANGNRPAGSVYARIVVRKSTSTDQITPTEAKNNISIVIVIPVTMETVKAEALGEVSKTNDNINKLIYNLVKTGEVQVNPAFYQGNLLSTTGALNPSDSTRVATDYIFLPEGTTREITCNTGYVLNSSFWYAIDKSFISYGSRPENAVYLRAVIKKTIGTDSITPTEAENNVTIKIKVTDHIDGIKAELAEDEEDIEALAVFNEKVEKDLFTVIDRTDPLFTSINYGGIGNFEGYAYPIKDISGIKAVSYYGFTDASDTIAAGIAKTVTNGENVAQKQYIVSGTGTTTTEVGYHTVVFNEPCPEFGEGYIILYTVNRSGITRRDHRELLNTNVVKADGTTYYVQDGTVHALATDKAWMYSPALVAERNAIVPKVNGMNYIYVATNGSDETGDGSIDHPYASIFKANASIMDNSADTEYTIRVADGTYTDLQTKYANAPQTTAYQGIVAKDHVYYEGNPENPNAVVIQWDGSYGYSAGVFNYADYGRYKCPFHVVGSNAGGGKTAIRGFKFVCSNTRYCLHIDTSGYGRGVDWVIEDCIFDWGGTPDCPDRDFSPPTIGDGSSSFEKGLIKNCIIKNASGIENGFMNHDCDFRYNSGTLKCGADLTIENCDFNGGAEQGLIVTMRNMVANSDYTLFNKVQIINCNGIKTFTYNVSSPATACNWRAEVKCTPMTTNKFADDGYMQ